MAYNVLIVDDSLPMRAVVKKTIMASGFMVGMFYDAGNGKEALEILSREWMDLVVTDYNMPDMNGLELLSHMKADEILKTIPVVVITTEGSQQRVREFMEGGAADYIRKPFTPEEIRNKLSRIMGETDGTGDTRISDETLDF
ncbi:MAG: response regulator [Deltaproteobacteria bacterium HGW-Deltaproteobacteria-21]|jgi:two-component system chemotaxis response regulator CheY|nr:MAG: response regulator [Deltaproteobacteria bacterium HGW-Deltaproteobacteria-21]PKN68167.1 MAG: response regulator [Deltaproteobacteria bacterium HGW-Deltaproteobacteria-15]